MMALIVIVVAPVEEIVTIVRQLHLNARMDAEGEGEGADSGGGDGNNGAEKTNNVALVSKDLSSTRL